MSMLHLEGIIPPLITPLKQRDELDFEGVDNMVEHVVGGGVHGVFVLGTTGEFPSLSEELKRSMVERACRQVNGRVPVLVGVTHTSPTDTIRLARFAADVGASAVVLSTPYYFPLSQPELAEYLEGIIQQLSLPVYLYNIPPCTKVHVEIDTLKRTLDLPKVVGYKDSSGNMGYFHQALRLQRERPGWSLLMGPEELLADAILAGAQGGVCGGANLYPRLFVSLYEAAKRGDLADTRRLHAKVVDLVGTLYRIGSYRANFVKSLKCALNVLSLCDDTMAGPFQKFSEEHRNSVARCLEELGITVQQARAGVV